MHARVNPFRVERVLQVRYHFSTGDFASLLTRWMECDNRGAIVGPEGTGKTTLLEDLVAPLRERSLRPRLLRVCRDDFSSQWQVIRTWGRQLTRQDVILVDGAEQFSRVAWWHFLWSVRSAGGILITTHQAGRLRTVWECSTSLELLSRIVNELTPQANFSATVLHSLYHRHRGNLRDALRELYDRHADSVKNFDSSLAVSAEGEENALNGPDELLS